MMTRHGGRTRGREVLNFGYKSIVPSVLGGSKQSGVGGKYFYGHSYIEKGKSVRIGKIEFSSQLPFHGKANAPNDLLVEWFPDALRINGLVNRGTNYI